MIGRWTVDKAFMMYTRTHNMSIIDGTILSSYHLGEDISANTARTNKCEGADWHYNRRKVSISQCDSQGRLKLKEVFCQ